MGCCIGKVPTDEDDDRPYLPSIDKKGRLMEDLSIKFQKPLKQVGRYEMNICKQKEENNEEKFEVKLKTMVFTGPFQVTIRVGDIKELYHDDYFLIHLKNIEMRFNCVKEEDGLWSIKDQNLSFESQKTFYGGLSEKEIEDLNKRVGHENLPTKMIEEEIKRIICEEVLAFWFWNVSIFKRNKGGTLIFIIFKQPEI